LMTSTVSEVHEAIAQLVPEIAARAAEVEERGCIPVDLFDALVATGCFGAHLPTAYGGLELPLREVNSIIEEIARADGSVGWVTMIAVFTPVPVALFLKDCFEEVYASGPNPYVRGALAPKGMAVPVDGGYLVSGQWPFASGGPQPQYAIGNCVVIDDGEQRRTPSGVPDMLVAMMPAADVEFLDTWHVTGLRGTDSCDFIARDVFVPLRCTTNVFTASPCVDIPMARVPLRVAFAPAHGALAVGIAQGALDDITTIAATKRAAMNPSKRLAADSVFQHTLGDQAMRLQAARALLAHHSELIWTAATTGHELTAVEIIAARSMAGCVTTLCVDVVDSAYSLAGSSSLYDTSPLQRRLRDIHVATQHIAATSETHRTLGALLVGEPVPPQALL
jgi:alkylation response protein AidB-like acyl-CoA dehydrogenase